MSRIPVLGLICDVCGEPALHQLSLEKFTIENGPKDLDVHRVGKCMERLRYAASRGDWTLLPPGPLRTAYTRLAR